MLTLLPITRDDLPFVRAMLYEAAFWRGASSTSLDDALRAPELAVYVEGWGRPGDTGLVARVRDEPAGAAWVRLAVGDQRGYGHVDGRTPELTIAVAAHHRGVGLGRCLLAAVLVDLRLRGTTQVSLSVELDNPARSLYEEAGFVPWATADGAVTMVRRL